MGAGGDNTTTTGGAAGARGLSEQDQSEPILRENSDRFCMFP